MTKQLQKNEKKTLSQLLMSDKVKAQFQNALPKHLTTDRFLRIVLTEIRKNPELAKCDQASFFGAVVQCAQLGLEPGDNLGRAYLLPFQNRKKGTLDCQLMIGYRGLLDLARRSGAISSISAHCIYEKDIFEFEYGIEEKLRHIPSQEEDKGKFIGAYAISKFKDGGYQFEVMFKNAIEKIRSTSKAGKSTYSPWNTHYDEMARKTALRRLCKYLPMSIETQQAVTLDEQADVGKQDLGNVFDMEPIEDAELTPDDKVDNAVSKMSDTLESTSCGGLILDTLEGTAEKPLTPAMQKFKEDWNKEETK